MKLFAKFTILSFVLIIFFSSCEEDDRFSTNPNLKLEFSVDTLRFDTVFTTIPSPTQEVIIRNRNNNSISFESIELVNGNKSDFRINVDGLAGTRFEGVDLIRKDSIYIRVDAKLDETTEKNILATDSICLKWNGNTEYIVLGAYGVNVYIIDDKIIDSHSIFTSEKGYYIKSSLTINENAILEVQEGVTFYLDKKASININGTIVAKGTIKKPITFRTHRFDFIERNIRYDNASDQWKGIIVGANSFNNIFENVRIRGSQKGIDFTASNPDKQKATLVNAIIHHTSEFGIKSINNKIDAINCQFSNSRGNLLNLIGGDYSFLHCTIANYYEWHPRTATAISLATMDREEKYPLTQCEFKNSIIVGSAKNEVSAYLDDSASFLFDNCVIQASGASSQPQFVNTIWNTSDRFQFKDLNSKKRFNYSFELKEGSSAIDAANATFAQDAPSDLRGKSRILDTKPDIGAYEW